MDTNIPVNNEEGKIDFYSLKGDNLTYIKKGVLWIQGEPYYIVEWVKEGNFSYVIAYNVHPGTRENPKKLAQEVTHKSNVFSQNTRLGRIANKMIPPKINKKWKPKPPVFVAPVLPKQTATLTGKIEEGFFEREPDSEYVEAGERKFRRGRATGVFIGLSSIDWEDKFSVPLPSIIEALNKHKQDMFYDLQGNNGDTGNPLSRYYEEGNNRE